MSTDCRCVAICWARSDAKRIAAIMPGSVIVELPEMPSQPQAILTFYFEGASVDDAMANLETWVAQDIAPFAGRADFMASTVESEQPFIVQASGRQD